MYEPGDAVIVGFGDSYAQSHEVRSPLNLIAEAASTAITESGIKKDRIDGLLTGRPPLADPRPQWNNIVASQLAMLPTHSTEITTHGAGIVGMLKHAAIAVTSGVAEAVLCVYADAAPPFVDAVAEVPALDADPIYEAPYGPSIPSLYAQWARRYMDETGATERDLARVSVSAQEWGRQHPYAAKRHFGAISVDDVLRSPMIATPLRRWNCAIWGPNGTGGAFVVVAKDKALKATGHIGIQGFGENSTHDYLSERFGVTKGPIELGTLPNLTRSGTSIAAPIAYEMAGVDVTDIDVFSPGTNFSHTAMMVVEDLGIVERGMAARHFWDGDFDPDGTLPFNTNGGWLSFGQPGISCAMDSVVEAIRQLRGQALGVQVLNAKRALVHSVGGILACHQVAILEAI